MTQKNWLWLALTVLAVCLVVLSNFVERNYEARKGRRHSAMEPYSYSPKGCLFQVEFREKPTVDATSSTDGVSVIKAETAQLIMTDDKSFVKSEFLVLGRDTIKNFTFDILHRLLQEYAANNGLSYPEFKDSESEFGRQVELRGYKTLKDENLQERHLVYTARLFFKENNLLILYAGSEAQDYPTPEIVKFFNSLKLKGKDLGPTLN